jgi:hypothetical protein
VALAASPPVLVEHGGSGRFGAAGRRVGPHSHKLRWCRFQINKKTVIYCNERRDASARPAPLPADSPAHNAIRATAVRDAKQIRRLGKPGTARRTTRCWDVFS